MHRNAMLMRRIRTVDTPPLEGSGAGDGDGGNPVDWEAKYKDAIAHSREWEKRAKDNKAAADELEKLKESQMSEAEKTARRISALEKENAAYKAEKQQMEWKAKVSKETGVPADVLRGGSEDEIRAHAESLKTLLNPKPKAPAVHGADRQPEGGTADERRLDYIHKLLGE